MPWRHTSTAQPDHPGRAARASRGAIFSRWRLCALRRAVECVYRERTEWCDPASLGTSIRCCRFPRTRVRADLLAVVAQDAEDRLSGCPLLRRLCPGRRLGLPRLHRSTVAPGGGPPLIGLHYGVTEEQSRRIPDSGAHALHSNRRGRSHRPDWTNAAWARSFARITQPSGGTMRPITGWRAIRFGCPARPNS